MRVNLLHSQSASPIFQKVQSACIQQMPNSLQMLHNAKDIVDVDTASELQIPLTALELDNIAPPDLDPFMAGNVKNESNGLDIWGTEVVQFAQVAV